MANNLSWMWVWSNQVCLFFTWSQKERQSTCNYRSLSLRKYLNNNFFTSAPSCLTNWFGVHQSSSVQFKGIQECIENLYICRCAPQFEISWGSGGFSNWSRPAGWKIPREKERWVGQEYRRYKYLLFIDYLQQSRRPRARVVIKIIVVQTCWLPGI